MAVYVVTESNWNDPAFWPSINESGAGHTLGFSATPSTETVVWDPSYRYRILSDSTTSFRARDAGHGGSLDATLNSSALLSCFTNASGTAGRDTVCGKGGSQTQQGAAGNAMFPDNAGSGSILGGAGNHLIQGQWGIDTTDITAELETVQLTTTANKNVIAGGESASDQVALAFIGAGVSINFTGEEAGTYSHSATGGTFPELEEILGPNGHEKIHTAATTLGTSLTGDGGARKDLITGGDRADLPTDRDGGDTPSFAARDGADRFADFDVGNSGLATDLKQTNHGFDGASQADNANCGIGDQLTCQPGSRDSITFDNTRVVCFTPGTRIMTPRGEVPIEHLRPGDRVMTRDNGLQPILWIAARCLSEKDLARWPTLRPIWIAPSLVGATAPLVVSPHHGMVLRMHPGDEYLVRAVHLARTPGGQARQMRGCKGITYIHLMFEYHQIIFANGAPSESFYPEPQAMSALDADARAELAALFPGLTLDNVPQSYGLSARQFAHLQDLPDHLRGFLAG